MERAAFCGNQQRRLTQPKWKTTVFLTHQKIKKFLLKLVQKNGKLIQYKELGEKKGILMKIGIVGAGAIGLFYAYQLSLNFPVTLYVKREEQLLELQQKGIKLYGNEQFTGEQTVRVKQLHLNDKLEEEVIILAVKQYALKDLMTALKNCRSDQTVLFLQNGMGHLKLLNLISTQRILLGVVEHGVRKIDDTSVQWTGKGKTKIAEYEAGNSHSPFLEAWNRSLSASFPLEICLSYEKMLKEKLVVNAIINPFTSIYRVKNGELLSNPFFYQAMEALYEELSFLIPKESKEDMWSNIVSICRNTAGNWSSMQRDIEYGRETEVEAILGYILFLAREQGEKTPLTEFIYTIVKGLEVKSIESFKDAKR
ncbi:2-dehydropantoate 2-reductase [Sutcliffiella deserti]|uniref:2-dehydropantoate 2-reductase n=1 Tax=Sutcliffiella deserti TaxID=2875501 RepID=UPI001CC1B974|nr:2-dehydropantoate 2-reductase [Sutcliffiella deserti]